MKGNYILSQVMLHGATLHRGGSGVHMQQLFIGGDWVHTQHSRLVFFFFKYYCGKNVFTVLLLSYLYYKLWQYTRGLLQREMLRESHLACCLCKQMADKQKIMNGWMDGRKDNLFQHQHKCRHISKKITTNATINVGQSKYSHSFTRFVH